MRKWHGTYVALNGLTSVIANMAKCRKKVHCLKGRLSIANENTKLIATKDVTRYQQMHQVIHMKIMNYRLIETTFL